MHVCSKLSGINNNLHVAKFCRSRPQTRCSEDNSMLSGASARAHKQLEVIHPARGRTQLEASSLTCLMGWLWWLKSWPSLGLLSVVNIWPLVTWTSHCPWDLKGSVPRASSWNIGRQSRAGMRSFSPLCHKPGRHNQLGGLDHLETRILRGFLT